MIWYLDDGDGGDDGNQASDFGQIDTTQWFWPSICKFVKAKVIDINFWRYMTMNYSSNPTTDYSIGGYMKS